jgi:DNA-binding transcriptional ArsR family regulator
MPHPLPESLAELIAERFRVIAEPMRIRILDRLRSEEATVGELAETLQTSQQNVSKHLAVLSRAGIVSREKHGTAVRCAIADPSVFDLCERVCGSVAEQVAELQAILEGQEAKS